MVAKLSGPAKVDRMLRMLLVVLLGGCYYRSGQAILEGAPKDTAWKLAQFGFSFLSELDQGKNVAVEYDDSAGLMVYVDVVWGVGVRYGHISQVSSHCSRVIQLNRFSSGHHETTQVKGGGVDHLQILLI